MGNNIRGFESLSLSAIQVNAECSSESDGRSILPPPCPDPWPNAFQDRAVKLATFITYEM